MTTRQGETPGRDPKGPQPEGKELSMTALPAQWKGLETLIPNTISVYLSKQAYEAPYPQGVGTAAPVDNTKPFKPWRDNSPLYPGSWFGRVSGPVLYTTLAVTPQGELALMPIESPAVYATYSDAVVRTYREYKHLFPNGVPVLTMLQLDRQVAGEFNYGSNGQMTPPPAAIVSNLMLAPAPNGEWMVIDYQDWIRIQRTAATLTDEQKVNKAVAIGQNAAMTYAVRVSAMREVLNTGLPPVGPVV